MGLFGEVSKSPEPASQEKLDQYHEPRHSDGPTFKSDYLEIVDPKTGTVIAHLLYPLEYCDGIECIHAGGKHPFSYHRPAGTMIWVHSDCGKPTRAHCSATIRDSIVMLDGKKLPWE